MRHRLHNLILAGCLAGTVANAQTQETRLIRVAKPICIGLADDDRPVGKIYVCDQAGQAMPKADRHHDPLLAQGGDYYSIDKPGIYTLRIQPTAAGCAFRLGFFTRDAQGATNLLYDFELATDADKKLKLKGKYKAPSAPSPKANVKEGNDTLLLDLP